MVKSMNDNVIENKSLDFAVIIVNLHKHLCFEKKSLFFQSNCYEAERV